ncbi:MAG TPA: DUF3786 domain-containing protein, partial [Thermoleophilia bacterium]|nr:DUF3786 domain-containing protein [Thermoleophilia bacterium]
AAACAAAAGCRLAEGGVLVPLFGTPHLVTHPGGEVMEAPVEPEGASAPGRPAHVAVTLLLLHYLLTADGTPGEGSWVSYRELPDGLFYAYSFRQRAEQPVARAFAGSAESLDGFRAAACALGGDALTLGDASFRFVALPRVDVAVLVWAGDDEEPGEARVLFDATAGHYLPAEDLAGLGGQLAHRLLAAPRG